MTPGCGRKEPCFLCIDRVGCGYAAAMEPTPVWLFALIIAGYIAIVVMLVVTA